VSRWGWQDAYVPDAAPEAFGFAAGLGTLGHLRSDAAEQEALDAVVEAVFGIERLRLCLRLSSPVSCASEERQPYRSGVNRYDTTVVLEFVEKHNRISFKRQNLADHACERTDNCGGVGMVVD
jgi:hypothetical protein